MKNSSAACIYTNLLHATECFSMSMILEECTRQFTNFRLALIGLGSSSRGASGSRWFCGHLPPHDAKLLANLAANINFASQPTGRPSFGSSKLGSSSSQRRSGSHARGANDDSDGEESARRAVAARSRRPPSTRCARRSSRRPFRASSASSSSAAPGTNRSCASCSRRAATRRSSSPTSGSPAPSSAASTAPPRVSRTTSRRGAQEWHLDALRARAALQVAPGRAAARR